MHSFLQELLLSGPYQSSPGRDGSLCANLLGMLSLMQSGPWGELSFPGYGQRYGVHHQSLGGAGELRYLYIYIYI